MTPDTARKLNPVVEHPHSLDAVVAYSKERIETLKEQLASELDGDAIRRLQGAIRELRRFATLREEVKGALRDENARLS